MSGGGRLVCLAGSAGAGKDAAGEYLVRYHGFQRVAVADPLKNVMMALFGLSREQLWGTKRNTLDARLGRAPRELYQEFGKACREIDPEVWIRLFRLEVEAIVSAGNDVVCTDLRTYDELHAVRRMGGVTWRIERTGAGAPGALARDSTETELALAPGELFDRIIRNDGTLPELYGWVETALDGSRP